MLAKMFGKLRSFLAERSARREGRKHVSTDVADTVRDAIGPAMRRNLGMPRSRDMSLIADSSERYQRSLNKNRSNGA